jgi:hypothetical protein
LAGIIRGLFGFNKSIICLPAAMPLVDIKAVAPTMLVLNKNPLLENFGAIKICPRA